MMFLVVFFFYLVKLYILYVFIMCDFIFFFIIFKCRVFYIEDVMLYFFIFYIFCFFGKFLEFCEVEKFVYKKKYELIFR